MILARELLTDNELQRLAAKYHHRHPTFTIDIQERTCNTIILACIYYYRAIQIDLRCQCIYNVDLRKFESTWSTDQIEYQTILDEIFINRALEDQIETMIEQFTRHFTRLRHIPEERRQEESVASFEIIKYERSPQSRRKVSWSE